MSLIKIDAEIQKDHLIVRGEAYGGDFIYNFGLCENPYAFGELLSVVQDLIFHKWKLKYENFVTGTSFQKAPRKKKRAWFTKKLGPIVNSLLYPHWRRYIDQLESAALFKAFYRVGVFKNYYGKYEDFLSLDRINQYFVLNNRAATILFASEGSKPFKDYWVNFYSVNGAAYENLELTLGKLPPAIPSCVLINYLPKVKLLVPLKTKAEIVYNIIDSYLYEGNANWFRHEQIRKFAKIAGLSIRRTRDLASLVGLCAGHSDQELIKLLENHKCSKKKT